MVSVATTAICGVWVAVIANADIGGAGAARFSASSCRRAMRFALLIGEIGDERRLRRRQIGTAEKPNAGCTQFRQQEAARIVTRSRKISVGATAEAEAVECE